MIARDAGASYFTSKFRRLKQVEAYGLLTMGLREALFRNVKPA